MKNKPFSKLINRIKGLNIFQRNKKPLETEVTTLIYQQGLSTRKTSFCVMSHESVRQWFKRLKKALPVPKSKVRDKVDVDETKLKVKGEQVYVWAAIDVDSKEILVVDVSKGRED